ncbi:MAG: aminotransferase class IV, partial [Gammaproteobacteria bacterium]|nr:aminotransferase class IV [Gammaproteobacteria bacterium]
DAQAEETLLIHNGCIMEGASSNVFAVQQGVVVTPPASTDLLPGVTRDLVLDLARDNGLACREDGIPLRALAAAEELWITSGSRRVIPVIAVDGRRIGGGAAGPVWQQVAKLFEAFIQRARQAPNGSD